MNDHKLDFDTWDELDSIDTELAEGQEFTHTLEISEDVVKEVKEKVVEKKEKKQGLFSKMFGKKPSVDLSDLDTFEDPETEVEEIKFSEELVSELSDTLDLSNELLDEALKKVNENDQIKEILSQPTEEISHLLDDLDDTSDLKTVEINDEDIPDVTVESIQNDDINEIIDQTSDEIIVDEILEDVEFVQVVPEQEIYEEEEVMELEEDQSTLDEITMELNSSDIIEDEIIEEVNDFENVEAVSISSNFDHVESIKEVIVEETTEEVIDQNVESLVKGVELPDTMMAKKYAKYMDEIFINESRDNIKRASFEFLVSEVSKIVKFAKDKISENDIEVQMLREEIKRRDDKIRILQDQVGNPFENYNRYAKENQDESQSDNN